MVDEARPSAAYHPWDAGSWLGGQRQSRPRFLDRRPCLLNRV